MKSQCQFARLMIGSFLMFSFAVGPAVQAQAVTGQQSAVQIDPSLFQVKIGRDILIQLPALPPAGEQRDTFLNLSPTEQASFYAKRKFLMQKMVGGLTRRGLGSGIRWTKNKVKLLIAQVKNWRQSSAPVAELMMSSESGPASKFGSSLSDPTRASDSESSADKAAATTDGDPESDLAWLQQPADLTPAAKSFVDQTVSAYLDTFWNNSTEIARSNGVGMTFVVGAIWNTTLGQWGTIHGRALSMDIGMNFATQEGYLRFAWDHQTKLRGGISFDVGLMADVLVHITDPDLQKDQQIEATHTKLPMVGCFRSGTNYKAWGAQLGLSVVEIAAVATSLAGYGHHGAVSALIPVMRGIGMATVYQTNLQRNILGAWKISGSNQWLRRLGFGSAPEPARVAQSCEAVFR